jgi:hypothetical protein
MSQQALVSVQADRAAVLRMIVGMAEIYGQELTDTRLEGYVELLSDIPTDALALGIQRAMRACNWFPKPAEIRRSVDAELAARQTVEQLGARVVSDVDPQAPTYSCLACEDTGWRYHDGPKGSPISIREAVDRGGPGFVSPCPCREHNPSIRRRLDRAGKRYAEDQP